MSHSDGLSRLIKIMRSPRDFLHQLSPIAKLWLEADTAYDLLRIFTRSHFLLHDTTDSKTLSTTGDGYGGALRRLERGKRGRGLFGLSQANPPDITTKTVYSRRKQHLTKRLPRSVAP